jgi:hypothetical protein
MKKVLMGFVLPIAALLPAATSHAQVAWESPLLVAPATPSGWGIYLVDPAFGRDVGVMATWRPRAAPGGLGYRFGIADGRADKVAGYGGIDFSGMLVQASDSFPLNMAWVTGVGLSAGEDVLVSVPLGVALGRDFRADGVWFNPYVAPRVVLDAWFGNTRPADDLDLRLAVDLGIDIAFQPGWAIRFAATLGDRSALAIGVGFRGP